MRIKSVIAIIAVVSVILAVSSYFALLETKSNDAKTYQTPLTIVSAKKFQLYQDDNTTILVDGGNRKIPLNKILSEPADRIIVSSSTHAAFINRLGVVDKIVGIAGANTHEWYLEKIKLNLEKGLIKDTGLGTNPDYDEIIALSPDIVILSGGTGMWEKQGKKLDELGIPYIVVSEWLENEPLGQFEWIKVFGLITGTQDKAWSIFEDASKKAEIITKTVSESKKPTILWVGVFKGIAHVPRNNSYVGELIHLVNAEYAFKNLEGTGSAQISIEDLLVQGKDADILVYSGGFINNTKEIIAINPLLSELGPIKNCNVYRFQPWYWESVDRYEDYINDAAAIAHPELFDNYQLKQFKKISCV